MASPSALDRTETLAPRAAPKGAPAEADAPPAAAPSDDPERYEQVAEHARGGLGRVMRAVDRRLGRTVAVKELLRHDGTNEARFMREAMITARLEHPGIVPVHEAGRWPNGDPYYVMKLVEGRTLKELIGTRHTLRDRLGLLPHVIAIADAVGYAHSEGVIHRDLKPSNVIVGEFGETIVVDWGLARDRKRGVPEPTVEHIVYAAGDRSQPGASTVSGKVVGTPAYMSPEQARGELVDERADVYAIGALLYELLAGTPPHHDETPQATLDRVIAGPPRPLGMIMPQVPSELATIVAKAMARCPDDRYSNASLLAEDLRRFHCGKLVSAHSYTAWSLLRKKLSHHRGAVVVAIASMVTLAAVGVASVRRVVAERNIAQHERERAVSSQAQTEHRQRELVLLQAETSLRKDPTATVAWLKTFPIGDVDRAHVLGVLDEAISLGVARHVFRTSDWVFDVDFTPDGDTVVAAVRDRVVRAYDVRTGEERQLGIAESTPDLLAMAPDGRFAVTAGMLGEVTLWPLDGGPSRVLSRGSRVRTLRLSPDGARVLVVRDTGAPIAYPTAGGEPAALGAPTTLRTTVADGDWSRQVVVDSLTRVIAVGAVGEPQRVIATTAKAIHRISMSPRGDQILIHDGEAIWMVPFTGGPLRKLVDYDAKLAQTVWSPDERTIAVGGDLHDILLVDTGTGAVRQLRGHTDANYALQWSRDGRRLLSASDDATARVWTVADGTSLALRGHDDDVFRARFSFDESEVVTASFDGTIRVWCVEQPGSRMLVEGDEIERLALDGDRALVKTSKEIAWWNLASGHRVPVFSWAKERGLGLAMASPDGEHLFVPNADGSAELRHRMGPAVTLRGHRAAITNVEFSRDSASLFTSSRDGTFRRWDVATGEGEVLLERESPVRRFAIAADGRIALVIDDELLLIGRDGKSRVLGSGPRWAGWVEFERVTDRLVLRRTDGGFAILDGERIIELPTGGFDPTQIAVSPDGKRIAGPLTDRTVRVWDVETGRVIDILRGHSDLVMDVAFSPDGTMLASASYDKTVRIWQLGANQSRVLRGHTGPVHEIEWWQPHRIVTGSRDGTLRIWDVPSLELPTARELADRMQRATTARIDIDRPTSGAPGSRGI